MVTLALAQVLRVAVPAESRIEVEAMIQNKDVGFVHESDPAEVKIDTFNSTKYGLLRGKVLSVSADSIQRDKPPGQAAAAEKTAGSSSRTSEPAGQELLYASCSTRRRSRSRTGWSTSRPAWR